MEDYADTNIEPLIINGGVEECPRISVANIGDFS
jgi:hypothetical protein